MAYDFFEEQDQQEDANKQQQETGMVALGPEGNTISEAKAPQGQPGAGTSSGSYTNLNSYLDANKSLGFGGKVAEKVQGEIDTAQGAQATGSAAFKQKADEGSVDLDQGLEESVRNDATQVVGDQGKFSDFLKARDAEYKGPRNFVDDTDAFRTTDDAQRKAASTAQAAGSEGGRQALLDNWYGSGAGRNDYTGGQKKLDNLLIQNDPASREAFAKTSENAAKTAQDYDSLKSQLSAYAGGKKSSTEAARARARGAVGIDEAGNFLATDATRGNAGAAQDLVEGIDERVASRRADLAGLRGTLDPLRGQKWLKDLSPAQLEKMGVDLSQIDQGVNLIPNENLGSYAPYYQGYKVDPGYLYQKDPGALDYLNFTADSALSRDTVSNQSELAKLNALAQLAGKENTFIGDPSVVGSQESAPLYGFQGSKFSSDVAAGRQAFQNELAAVRDKYRNAEAGHQNTVNSGGLGSSDSGGVTDPSKELAEVNVVRVKYGLPPITV